VAAPSVRNADAGDAGEVVTLLRACKLPMDGVPDDLTLLLVAEQDGRVVGCAGLERYGADGLLRSVAVSPECRGCGLAGSLCDEVEARAASLGMRRLYLLTETAEAFFRGRGYEAVDRAGVPPVIGGSRELASVCPASAVLMLRAL
jgi:amino-acid N-acetyltransferase